MPLSETAHRLFDAFDTRDLEIIGAYLRDDLKVSGNVTRPMGKPEFLALLSAYYSAFPDFDFNFTEADQTGKTVRAKYAISGTHQRRLDLNPIGTAVTIEPTGTEIHLPQSVMEITFDEDGLVSGLVLHQAPGAAMPDLLSSLGVSLPQE